MNKEKINEEFRKFMEEEEGEEVEPIVLSKEEFIIIVDNAFDTLAQQKRDLEEQERALKRRSSGLSDMVQKSNFFEAHPDFTVLYVQRPDNGVLALRVESKGDMGFKHEGKTV